MRVVEGKEINVGDLGMENSANHVPLMQVWAAWTDPEDSGGGKVG